jgi:hypothetical protein
MQQGPPPELRGIQQSTKPHKFFERHLNNDLDLLANELIDRYQMIEKVELDGITPVNSKDFWQESGSVSTVKWREYNVFQFHIEGIYELYKNIQDMTKEACEYYEIDFEKKQFMLQGWFNINYTKKGKLNWHDHGHTGAPDNFHGYYCVKAEPSTTYYRVFGKDIENKNIDNRAIFSEMGHPHAQGDWDWEGPRITVAYDVMTLNELKYVGKEHEQHWIPLV